MGLTKTTAGSVPANTNQDVTNYTAVVENTGGYGVNLVAGTITIPETGVYVIAYTVPWVAAGGNTARVAVIYINSSGSRNLGRSETLADGGPVSCTGSTTLLLQASDTVVVNLFNGDPGTINYGGANEWERCNLTVSLSGGGMGETGPSGPTGAPGATGATGATGGVSGTSSIWRSVVPAGNFTAPPAGYQVMAYYASDNTLVISGMLAATAGFSPNNVVLFNLPAGFRPADECQFPASLGDNSPISVNGDTTIRILTNGDVTMTNNNFMNANDVVRISIVARLGSIGSAGATQSLSRTYPADAFEAPNNNDWAVNSLAPLTADAVNAALLVRAFDPATAEGVGLTTFVPSGVSNIVFTTTFRGNGAGGGTVAPVLHYRAIPDGAALPAWSSAALTDLAVPADTLWHQQTDAFILANIPLTTDTSYQFEWVRDAASDTLASDLLLQSMVVAYTY